MGVHLLTGDDESILITAVGEVVRRLLGDEDRTLALDEFDGPEYTLGAVVDSAQTPPFLTEKRVVVARGVGRFTADDVGVLVSYLTDPAPTTELVLVGGGGRLAKQVTDAVKKSGGTVIDSSPPSRPKDRQAWVAEQATAAGVRLDPQSVHLLSSWLGEDAGRLQGILETLLSTYGADAAIRPAQIEPFLGEAGGVAPWDLTDAIDKGETTTALRMLHRMMGAGERHPLAVLSILHGHYVKMLSLDGSGARDEASAAEAMGIKPGFPARKALDQYRRLGGNGVSRAVGLLAQADLDLKGLRDLPGELVMEVLVARLSRLARR